MPMTTEYWFARRFSLDSPSKAMAPVHWKGWAAAAVFVAGMALGGLGFAWMAAIGEPLWGVITFAIAAFVSGAWFITVAIKKGDHRHTVADYRNGGVGA